MLGQGGSPIAKERAKRWLRRPTCRVTARTLSHHVLFTDGLPSTVKEEALQDVFYHDCPHASHLASRPQTHGSGSDTRADHDTKFRMGALCIHPMPSGQIRLFVFPNEEI